MATLFLGTFARGYLMKPPLCGCRQNNFWELCLLPIWPNYEFSVTSEVAWVHFFRIRFSLLQTSQLRKLDWAPFCNLLEITNSYMMHSCTKRFTDIHRHDLIIVKFKVVLDLMLCPNTAVVIELQGRPSMSLSPYNPGRDRVQCCTQARHHTAHMHQAR